MERDAEAAGLARRGFSYRQIMAQMGYRSTASVSEAIKRHLAEMSGGRLANAEALQHQLDRLDDYRRQAYKVLATRHYVTTQSGRLAQHPVTEELVVDDGPVLQALDRLLRYDEHEARLLGLYAPVRHEVRNIDAIDAELLDLADKVAVVGSGDTAPVPSEA